jgi:predicted nucleotidyltransferase component of viral defense system
MQDLIKQEQFELEVLDKLNSKKLLDKFAFGGGTMLRLCHGLDRYSIDLDFWIIREVNRNKLLKGLKRYLSEFYDVVDSADKFYTLLLEIRSHAYPRSLKIEIRKETKHIKTETAIAYSKYSNLQVFLRTVTLEAMAVAKIEALLERKEIRDAFDLEFLVKRGVGLNLAGKKAAKALEVIDNFSKRDYAVKLGSLLEPEARKYYTKENFKILKSAVSDSLT